MDTQMFSRIAAGRTDLVFDYVARYGKPFEKDENGVSLIRWCAWYGDTSAVKFLLSSGESIHSLGPNLDLNGAAFHGHWRLCEFLIENGADANFPLPDTGETPLHAALCTSVRTAHDVVLRVLLKSGANPNAITIAGVETGCFMRDCRTRGETPLHRAAAFGSEDTIRMLVAAGGDLTIRDVHGDSPLSWASWYGRPDNILRLLLYGPHSIRPGRKSMAESLQGFPDPS